MADRPMSSEIIHLAHHAAGQAALWSEVARLLGRQLDASCLGFIDHNFDSKHGRIVHAFGFSADSIDLYARHYAGRNAWLLAGFRFVSGQIMTGAELVPNWELVRTEFYKSWLRPQNAFHCLIGVIHRNAEQIRCLMALRPLDGAPFGTEEKRVVGAILPQLDCASELDSRFASLARRSNVLEDILGCLPEGIFVVDADSHVLIANAAAQRLLEQKDGLVLSRGALGTSQPRETAELRRLIARAATRNGNGSADEEIAVNRPSGDPPTVLTLAPLGHTAVDGGGRETGVALVITQPLQRAVSPHCLSEFYHMTPAEARLAALIASGRTLIEAAAELRITTNTARTHMKRIYSKTVTHRQADLVRLLSSGFVRFH
jgi:DNA-binding CsgD family transcriptional regulator/PAS domain-containing protein